MERSMREHFSSLWFKKVFLFVCLFGWRQIDLFFELMEESGDLLGLSCLKPSSSLLLKNDSCHVNLKMYFTLAL